MAHCTNDAAPGSARPAADPINYTVPCIITLALAFLPSHLARAAPELQLKLPAQKPDWTIEWWDTVEGKPLTTGEITATAGALQLEPPPFQADIAARLKRR